MGGMFLFLSTSPALAMYSPAYRARTLLDEQEIGHTAISATIQLPTESDIKGVGPTGAAYNYLGIETANGNSLEIGLHQDTFDKENQQWSVFAMATYQGAYSHYGSNAQWHSFRKFGGTINSPHLVFPAGSIVTMTLQVTGKDEVIFEIPGFESIRLVLPGADPSGEKQILRRVTSLMTNDSLGYSQNNIWQEVKTKRAGEPWQEWIPTSQETFRSNNMDGNDPRQSWVTVRVDDYYPELVDIVALEEPRDRSVFQVGTSAYYLNGEQKEADAKPFIAEGRTYLPVRYLAYACGISEGGIQWDEHSKTVRLSARGITENLTVGQSKLEVNNSIKEMDVVPLLREGRVYVPARFVAETFGFYVEWDPLNKTVIIYPYGSPKPNNPF